MERDDTTRRRFLATVGLTGATAIAGCAGLEAPRESLNAATENATVENPADDTTFVELYDAISPGVVELVRHGGSPFEPDGGSGFLIDDDVIVTNAHVIEGVDSVDVRFHDGEWTNGTVVQSDMHSDLAVIEPQTIVDSAEILPFEADLPDIGSPVMAIGAPFGLAGSASTGIVSGVNRSLPSPTGFSIPAAIQTDAAVNPGNSGGPLMDTKGRVRGVVFAGAGENLGFAISSQLATRVVPTLRAGREFEHSYLGVAMANVTPPLAEANDLDEIRGILIERVIDDTPADGVLQGSAEDVRINGGQVPVGGDVIRAIDDQSIDTVDDLSTHLALATDPGDVIAIDLVRDGESETVDLELGVRPDEPEFALPP